MNDDYLANIEIYAFRHTSEIPPSLRAAFGYGYLAQAVTRGATLSELFAVIRGVNRAIEAGSIL
jgi:hypothetical protein